MPKEYLFRSDDGEEISVDFETMMNQKSGFIESGGKLYRRVGGGSFRRKSAVRGEFTKLVSDTLGFPEHQLGEFVDDKEKHGFRGVEFKPDPDVPQFYQVHFSDAKEWKRYVKHRGYTDMNGKNGGSATLTKHDIQKAKEFVNNYYKKT